jgi:hypothetical protein
VLAALVVPAVAVAHIERASYWPDPSADTSVTPPTGGEVPKKRSLSSALKKKPPGKTRVVCQGKKKSFKRAKKAIKKARKNGFDVRPHDHRSLKKKKAKRLKKINRKLKRKCKFNEIQPAVDASGNNDRVVVMPGVYTEPTARSKPTDDPACDKYEITNDKNQAGAVSYAYQFHCPNDQNLIAVIGRALGPGSDPQPPLDNRHGIPNEGECIRCNFQLEGSGPSPDDVVVEAGNPATGNGPPHEGDKDVGIRADRADGFVLRNMTVRHVNEHAIYVLEADGYLLDKFKTFYAAEYGVLTFNEDHGLIQNCEAAGSGDAGLYPGAGAEGGDQRPAGTKPRYTQEMRFCDSHHNALGYSGTSGNSVHVHHNNFYGNMTGWSTDVFTAAGHPGFPQDSDLIEHNDFYSNNFNAYQPGSDVEPTVPVPVGVGMWIAGGNHNIFRENRVWDNWRRGSMLFQVPNAFVTGCGEKSVPECDPTELSTSHNNEFRNNEMGVAPNGDREPNGTDFWWDDTATSKGNCWVDNTGSNGKESGVTTDPSSLPADCGTSSGTGTSPENVGELLNCAVDITNPACTWDETPPKPSK